MTKQEMMKLEDGTLLHVSGKNFEGTKVNRLFIFEKKNLNEKGYRLGCWLYPFDWFKLPTKKQLNALVNKIRSDAESQVVKYCNAYEKSKLAKGDK